MYFLLYIILFIYSMYLYLAFNLFKKFKIAQKTEKDSVSKLKFFEETHFVTIEKIREAINKQFETNFGIN